MANEDQFRNYFPLMRRVIMLVAVLTAVPVILWTITVFVRGYFGPPKIAAARPLAAVVSVEEPATPAAGGQDAAARPPSAPQQAKVVDAPPFVEARATATDARTQAPAAKGGSIWDRQGNDAGPPPTAPSAAMVAAPAPAAGDQRAVDRRAVDQRAPRPPRPRLCRPFPPCLTPRHKTLGRSLHRIRLRRSNSSRRPMRRYPLRSPSPARCRSRATAHAISRCCRTASRCRGRGRKRPAPPHRKEAPRRSAGCRSSLRHSSNSADASASLQRRSARHADRLIAVGRERAENLFCVGSVARLHGDIDFRALGRDIEE